MRRLLVHALIGLGLVGCGQKAQEVQNAANVMAAAGAVEEAQNEAEKFYAERRAKGDTVAMPYADLQKMLPEAPADYAADGEPGGSSQSMTGFSVSQAEQTYSRPAGADGSAPQVHVTVMDFGGTEAAYGMMALPMMVNLQQEDAHRRYRTLKMSLNHTWGAEEYDKDNKDAKVTVVTRYRYLISVEARNQSEDQSALAKDLAEAIAKKLADK